MLFFFTTQCLLFQDQEQCEIGIASVVISGGGGFVSLHQTASGRTTATVYLMLWWLKYEVFVSRLVFFMAFSPLNEEQIKQVIVQYSGNNHETIRERSSDTEELSWWHAIEDRRRIKPIPGGFISK